MNLALKFKRVAALSPPFFVVSAALAQTTTDTLDQVGTGTGGTAQALLLLGVVVFFAFALYLGIRIASRGPLRSVGLLALGGVLTGAVLQVLFHVAAEPKADWLIEAEGLSLILVGSGGVVLVITLIAAALF